MAMDMSKVTGNSSTDLGISLLAEKQASNKRIRSENASNANKDALKSLGLQVGIGFAEDFQEKKRAKFLADETNAANILQTKRAYKGALQATQEEESAQAYTGGYDSYFNAIAEKNVREALTAQYAEQGVYSKVQFDGLVKSGSFELGKKLQAAHKDKYNYAQDYLQTTGEGGQSAYLDNLKKQTPTNLKSMVNGFIGNVTGLSGGDALNQQAESILGSAKQFENYQKVYQETKNSDVSLLFAEALPEELNPAALTYGKTPVKTGTNILGEDTFAVMVSDPNQNGKTWLADLSNGEVQTSDVVKKQNSFSSLVSNLKDGDSFSERGIAIAMKIPDSLKNKLAENLNDKATEAGSATWKDDKGRIAYVAAQNKQLQKEVGAVALQLKSSFREDIGDDQIDTIASSLLAMHINNPKMGVMRKGAGVANPYFTLLAIDNAVSSGAMKKNNAVVSKILGEGGINLYSSYAEASKNEKVTLLNILDTMHENNKDKGSQYAILKTIFTEANTLQLASSQTDNTADYLNDRQAYRQASINFNTGIGSEIRAAQSAEKKVDMNNVFKALSVMAEGDNDPSPTLNRGSKKYKASVAIVKAMTPEQQEKFTAEKNNRIDYLKTTMPKVSIPMRGKMRTELKKLENNYDGYISKYFTEAE